MPGSHSRQAGWRGGGRGQSRRPLGPAGRPPWASGPGAKHDQAAGPAVRTRLAGPAGWRVAVVSTGGRFRGSGGRGGSPTRPPERDARPEGPVRGTPPPLVAALMDAVGPHRRPQAPETRLGREGQGCPALERGVLITTTDLPLVEREPPGVRPREAGDVPAPVAQHLCRAWHGRLARDDPRGGPDGLGNVQRGALLRHESAAAPAAARGARPHRHEGGLAGRGPRRPVPGDPTGRDQAVDVRMVDQRPGPGVQDAEDPQQPPHQAGPRPA